MFTRTETLLDLFDSADKHCHMIGSPDQGVLVGLHLEGRLFASMNGLVLNRVNPDAVTGHSDRGAYLNPGGDGLWPAPEGTTLGYEYSTGAWRVPPGLTNARFVVVARDESSALVQAEIDLVNNSGIGVPALFSRDIRVSDGEKGMRVKVLESIEYIGDKPLSRETALLAPWSLCQFDTGPGCEAAAGIVSHEDVWDLYFTKSDAQRRVEDGVCITKTDGGERYQLGLSSSVKWVEFRNPNAGLTVRRTAGPLPKDQSYIDIADIPPDKKPSSKTVAFSIYSDPTCFMEIEAAGGSPDVMNKGTVMSVEVVTEYIR